MYKAGERGIKYGDFYYSICDSLLGVSFDVMKFAEYSGGVFGHCVVQNGDGEEDVLGMGMMRIRISWLMDGVFDRAFVWSGGGEDSLRG